MPKPAAANHIPPIQSLRHGAFIFGVYRHDEHAIRGVLAQVDSQGMHASRWPEDSTQLPAVQREEAGSMEEAPWKEVKCAKPRNP